jgi:hypothetical protein
MDASTATYTLWILFAALPLFGEPPSQGSSGTKKNLSQLECNLTKAAMEHMISADLEHRGLLRYSDPILSIYRSERGVRQYYLDVQCQLEKVDVNQ